jgi:hypothetical protein
MVPARPHAATTLVGSTEQNDCAAYLQSFGYLVDLVGYPKNPDGTANTDSVIILMPVASPGFAPRAGRIDDPETVKQVFAGLRAAGQYLPKTQARAVGLEWNQYIIMLPVAAEAWQQYLTGTRTAAEIWRQIAADSWVLDNATGAQVPPLDFTHKDFTGGASKMAAMPPPGERPALESGQIRLDLSTAYLPDGDTATLLATVLTSTGAALPGQPIEFAINWPDQDPQVLTTTQTDGAGTARVPFRPPAGTQGGVLVTASSPALLARATAILVTGPPVSGTTAITATMAALRLQGYDLLAATYDPGALRARVTAMMATPRIDRSMHTQMAVLFGTLFTAYPQATDALVALIYRSGNTPYELHYVARRADWVAWMGGAMGEATWWDRMEFVDLLNATTGQPALARDFLTKDFGFPAATRVNAPQSVESRLVHESWGDQLYSGRFRVPPGGMATGFGVEERTPGADWAIYATTDPVHPLYQAGADPAGTGLAALQLGGGEYMLAVGGPAPPATVRLHYVEYVLAPAGP